MNRLEQKCLIASAGMHGLLILLLVVGSAFLLPPEPPPKPLPRLTVVPDFLVMDALAGGGGNPNVKPNDGRQKGDTLEKPPEVKPPEAKPPQPKPPAKETKPPEAKPDKPAKAADSKPEKLPLKEVTRPDPAKTSPNALPSWLKEVSKADREKAAAEEAARQWAANAAAARKAIGSSREGLREVKRGFADGTVVEAWGPGGPAYASYDAFLKEVYENAWARERDSLTAEAGTCVVRVTIARNGDVLSARIIQPSGNTAQDASVRRVLRAVKFVAPFPPGTTEKEITRTINFSREPKRGIG